MKMDDPRHIGYDGFLNAVFKYGGSPVIDIKSKASRPSGILSKFKIDLKTQSPMKPIKASCSGEVEYIPNDRTSSAKFNVKYNSYSVDVTALRGVKGQNEKFMTLEVNGPQVGKNKLDINF